MTSDARGGAGKDEGVHRVVAVGPLELTLDAALAVGTCVAIERDAGEPWRGVVVEVAQDRSRCAALLPTIGVARGAVAADTGADATIASLLGGPAETGWRRPLRSPLPTGVAVIDELAPLARGGAAAIVGLDGVPATPTLTHVVAALRAASGCDLVRVASSSAVDAGATPDAGTTPRVELAAYGDDALPGVVLGALARALELARAAAPSRHVLVEVAGLEIVAASLGAVLHRRATVSLERWLDLLEATGATVLLGWTSAADELDGDPLHGQLSPGLDATLVVSRELASLEAPWPIDPQRSSSRHPPADPDGALALRGLLARGALIRQERLPILGAEGLDPGDRDELGRATMEAHRLAGLASPPPGA